MKEKEYIQQINNITQDNQKVEHEFREKEWKLNSQVQEQAQQYEQEKSNLLNEMKQQEWSFVS